MPRSKRTRKPNVLAQSRIDWGDNTMRDLKSSLKSSFTWSKDAGSSGGSSMASASAATSVISNYGPQASRYDPKSAIRIDNLNDLVDEDTESDVDGIDSGRWFEPSHPSGGTTRKKSYRNASVFCRQALVIVASVGVIVGASVGIRAVVISGGGPFTHSLAVALATPSSDVGGSITVVLEQQRLLEIAERVVSACSEYKINEDLSDCQKLCQSNMCCFEKRQYSCEDDESKDCAVYAGCEALFEGVRGRKWG